MIHLCKKKKSKARDILAPTYYSAFHCISVRIGLRVSFCIQGLSHDMNDVQGQIQKLNRKHVEAMAAIANLSREPTRSYIYVPRDRHIQSFSGDFRKDERTVDEFIEELERVLLVRNQTPEETNVHTLMPCRKY